MLTLCLQPEGGLPDVPQLPDLLCGGHRPRTVEGGPRGGTPGPVHLHPHSRFISILTK